ncbi:MAG TPA: hypothetical protein VNB22_00780 [Pyrinomonadaceae bacterium]|nr:hypothetical protein [Pyrinomonadaceae bacterium]
MKFNVTFIFFAVGLLFGGAIISFAQDKTDFKVGDTIYVNAFSGGCVKATVRQTDPKYSVHIEEGTYKDRDTFYNADRLGECRQAAPQNNQTQGNQNTDKPDDNRTPNGGNFKTGMRVDVYLSDNKEGKNRGTIIEINGSQYKVHYDGCSEKYDVWENSMFVRPAATISADNAEIKFLVGKWSMTSVAVNGNASGTIAAWGKSPGIQINADGTYVWYQDGGRPPVKGKWTTHAKIEGARYGTETENGIIIKDAKGAQWKMYRRKSTIDNFDHINIRSMCESLTQMGTRVK